MEEYAEYSREIIKNGEVLGYLAQELSSAEKEMSVYEFLTAEPAFFDMAPKELAVLSGRLLLDEPSNDIDIQTLEWLEGGFYKGEQGAGTVYFP